MEKTLESIKKYTLKPDKVIVSMSPRYLNLNLHNEAKRLENKFVFLKCLVQDKVTGVGENLNKCFKDPYVDTDYVTIWGADDFFHPQYFEILKTIILKHDPNILIHSYEKGITKRSSDLNIFKKIDLDKIKTYNDLYLQTRGARGMYKVFSRKWNREYNNRKPIFMHYGMTTYKKHIVKENKFKEGPKFDCKSDSLFLTEMFRKYSNMIFIDENMIHYVPSGTSS
jgi:hypothetical protein